MKKNLSIAAVASLIMIFILRWEGACLKTAISPRGILDLEFADTPARLNELMNIWNRNIVRGNIWLDFLFIVSYVMFLSIASELTSAFWSHTIIKKMGLLLAKAAYFARILDIAENLLMLQSIAGNETVNSLQLTAFCAGLKFIIAGIVLLYLIISLPVIFRNKPSI